MFPQSIADVICSSEGDKKLLTRIATGEIPFPSSTTRSILFYGRYGTGKTTTAYMFPALLEYLHAQGDEQHTYDWCYRYMGTLISVTPQNNGLAQLSPQGDGKFLYINCGEVLKATAGFIDIMNKFSVSYWGNFQPCNKFIHIVLDEVDCLDKKQQELLKGFITDSPPYVVYYLTTNNYEKLDGGLKSRAYEILMDGVNTKNKALYIKTLKREFSHLNDYSDKQLEQWVQATDGDWRELEQGAYRM